VTTLPVEKELKLKSDLTKQQKHDNWVQVMHADPCVKCGLHRTRRNIVLYRGNPYANLMGIGEAPGGEEDIRGFAFVGQAGQSLDKMLKYMDIDPPDQGVYLCNVLKCRPPGNRNPEPDEVEMCMPYLYAQIELVQPKIIMVIGKVAAVALGFLENYNKPLKPVLDTWLEYRGIPTAVIYHPAYLLRNASKKREQAKYLRTIADRLHKQW
jgi:uracil-DNA glycosylase family 4